MQAHSAGARSEAHRKRKFSRNLQVNLAKIGAMSVYADVRIGNEEFKTGTESGMHPMWNESKTFFF